MVPPLRFNPERSSPGEDTDQVLTYLDDVVARLERLGDRLESYLDPVEPQARKGTDDPPPSS